MRILDDCAYKRQSVSMLQRLMRLQFVLLGMLIVLVTSSVLYGEETPSPILPGTSTPDVVLPEKHKQVPITKVSEGVYKIGKVVVDQKKREVRLEGVVNMQQGLVEYLAVADRGKLHESVLLLDAEPIHLQLGLILLGLKYGRNLKFQGDTDVPLGDHVDIFVEWMDKGKKKQVRAEDLIFNQQTGKSMRHTSWVFSGSVEMEETFVAGVERSIIATYHDPASIIDNPLPEGEDDTILYSNEKLLPTAGTEVTVFIRALKK